MTILVASRDGWVAADTRVCFGQDAPPFSVNKIIDLGHTVIGCAGAGAMVRQFTKVLSKSKPEAVLEHITEFIEDKGDIDGGLLLVNNKNEIWRIDGIGGQFLVNADHWTYGSAQDRVLGMLDAKVLHTGRKVTPEDAVQAIAYCARMDMTINDQVDVIFVGKKAAKSRKR